MSDKLTIDRIGGGDYSRRFAREEQWTSQARRELTKDPQGPALDSVTRMTDLATRREGFEPHKPKIEEILGDPKRRVETVEMAPPPEWEKAEGNLYQKGGTTLPGYAGKELARILEGFSGPESGAMAELKGFADLVEKSDEWQRMVTNRLASPARG